MRRADPVRELARHVRCADKQCHNIGLFLRQHAEELGPALGLDDNVLQGMSDQPDHLLAPKIEVALRGLKERLSLQVAELDKARSKAAARQLAAGARFSCGRVGLDPALLLGDLLVDKSVKYVAFVLVELAVAVERKKLTATAKVIASKADLAVFVDSDGVHFRWNSGRAGLNWHPQPVLPGEQGRVLHVPLPKLPARRPMWSWDALAEVSASL